MEAKRVVADQRSDANLLRRIALGESAAEEELFNTYVTLVLAVAGRFGLSPHDAQELAQDVLFDTLGQARRGRLRDPVRPWLIRVTSNRAIDWKRDAGRQRKWQDDATNEFMAGLERRDEECDDAVASYPKVAVRQALLAIRSKEKRCNGNRDGDTEILLWIGHGASNSDLADYLGITENAARQRRKRALDRFKAALGGIYEEMHNPISSEGYEEL